MSAQRPRKERAGARILVRAGQLILLQQRHDPGVPGYSWWTLPGGGVDEGESSRDAAARELLEETGIIVAPSQLQGPVAVRTVTHGYSDRILRQYEEFFVADIPSPQDVRPLGWTSRERQTMGPWAWVDVTKLGELADPLWEEPTQIVAALANPDTWPVRFDAVEHSSVPVD